MGVKSGLHQNLARNSSELEKSRWPKLGIPFLGVRCKKCAFLVQFATQNFDYLRTVDTNNFSVGANSALKFCGAPTGINKSTSTKFERAIHIKSKFMTKIIWQKYLGCAGLRADFFERPKNGIPNLGRPDFSSSHEFRAKIWWRPRWTPKKQSYPVHRPPPVFFRNLLGRKILVVAKNGPKWGSTQKVRNF